ncbi:MAG: YabP/YqfC family sporulation protein [Acutalibacteraceae bacterium]|nr:YabP/YqfC family sporulation protein [Acutalibacteraceae bacterium]
MSKIKNKIDRISDITAKITKPVNIDITSNNEALINGSRGIIEYNEEKVKINCGNHIVSFYGNGLGITSLCVDEVLITGELIRIDFADC